VRIPHSHRGVRPAHDAHDRPVSDAKQQQHGCSRVARVVESRVSHAGVRHKLLPPVPVGTRVQGMPGLIGEQPAFVGPERGCLCTLRSLRGAMSFE
jgi:hypothetical protein